MENMLIEKINKSELSNSGKYLHAVRLNANDDSTYEVVVTRHSNWGESTKDIKNIKKGSLSEAEEIFNFYVRQLKDSVKK